MKSKEFDEIVEIVVKYLEMAQFKDVFRLKIKDRDACKAEIEGILEEG